MQKKKNWLSILMISILALVLVSGCGQNTQPDKSKAQGKEEESQEEESQEEQKRLEEERIAAEKKQEETLLVETALLESEALSQSYRYDEAMTRLDQLGDNFKEHPGVVEARQRYQASNDAMVPYTEDVRHVFFHSLIVDTTRTFDGDNMENGYNYWMTTIDEFNAIMNSMYERGYILIDIHELTTTTVDENGVEVMVRNTPLVPEGKIPFVLSIDDVNYYEYMREDGFATNLMLDDNNEVKNLYIDGEGQEHVGNYDVVPLLDQFVKEHPDFSLRGAKGIIAETGYEGALGYRTNDVNSPTYEQDKETVRTVANRLKETGWEFAVHGYGHQHTQKISYEKLIDDTQKWKNQVGSLVGDTDIYIYPYGEEVDYPSDKADYLKAQGYKYFCGVWSKRFEEVNSDYVRQTRFNLDGFTMHFYPERCTELFDAATVIDSKRPEFK